MALNNKPTAAKFEDEAVAKTAAASAATASNSTAAVTPTTTTNLPAAANNTAIASPATKFVNIGKALLNAMPPVPFGGLPTLKAKSGFVVDDADANLGNSVTLEVLSYNYKWMASPGEEGAEAAKLLRTSYDSETIENDGSSLRGYVEQLKADGYEKAKITKRVDVVGTLLSCAKEGYPRVGDIVMIDLAPTSVARFEGQILQASAKLHRGGTTADKATHMTFNTVPKSAGGKSWSAFDTVSAA